MYTLIRVELKDGSVCRMVPRALNIFLSQDKVVKFERSGGWAVVGLDPLRRTVRKNSNYGSNNRAAV